MEDKTDSKKIEMDNKIKTDKKYKKSVRNNNENGDNMKVNLDVEDTTEYKKNTLKNYIKQIYTQKTKNLKQQLEKEKISSKKLELQKKIYLTEKEYRDELEKVEGKYIKKNIIKEKNNTSIQDQRGFKEIDINHNTLYNVVIDIFLENINEHPDNIMVTFKKRLFNTIEKFTRTLHKLDNNLLSQEDLNQYSKINEVEEKLKYLFKFIIEINTKNNTNLPFYLQNILYTYQKQGVDFLLSPNNKILADEMGLGKTIQTIVAIGIYTIYSKNNSLTLILCPLSVINQWVMEFYKFFPFIRVIALHSSFDNIEQFNKTIKCPTVIITSYETFKNHIDSLSMRMYDFFVLDEGHKIKNFKTKIFDSANRVSSHKKIILSGTPIQNNLKELYSLMSFINKKVFGDYKSFYDHYESQIIVKKQTTDDDNSEINEKNNKFIYLKTLIAPYFLRRDKSIVYKDLPKKRDKIVLCPMTEGQENLYIKELDKQEYKHNTDAKISDIMKNLHRLRKIANHPLLLTKHFYEEEVDNINNVINTDNSKSEDDINMLNTEKLPINHTSYTINKDFLKDIEKNELKVGKFAVLKKLLRSFINEGRKSLIFTQTHAMVDLISLYLTDKKILHKVITGKTLYTDRIKNINEFEQSKITNVLLLTTRVGCLGLNLISASRLIIYDPDWNPSMDQQAKERIYRFGQKNDVETYTLLSKNSIEEIIYDKQILKNILAMNILNDECRTTLMKEVKNLFKYNKPRDKCGIIKDIEEKTTTENYDYDICNLTGRELIEFIEYREKHFN